jgi:hypothetical protein
VWKLFHNQWVIKGTACEETELYFRERKTTQGQDQHHKLEQNKFREGHTQSVPNLRTLEEASFISLASEFTILFLALSAHKKQLRNADNITKGDIPGYPSAAVVDTTHNSLI